MAENTSADTKTCPFCAETIKAAAIKCRFCQSDLTDTSAAPALAAIESDKTGAPLPTVSDEDEPPAETDEPPAPESWSTYVPDERTSFLASTRLLGILVALCLVLAGVAGYAWWRSEHPDDGKTPEGAITSSQARDAGMAAAAKLTEKVLSYNWQTLDADTKAAEALLAPSFRAEYAKTMAGVKDQTIKNQVKLSADVAATSIVSATENKVVALLFVNQVTTAKGTANQRLDGSRVLVTLTRGDGEWRISKLKAF